jgi:hypothetical protein
MLGTHKRVTPSGVHDLSFSSVPPAAAGTPRTLAQKDFLDLSKAFKPGQEQKRVNVDFPVWMIDRLDREAGRLGVPRQSLIKVWIGEHLQRDTSKSKKEGRQSPM